MDEKGQAVNINIQQKKGIVDRIWDNRWLIVGIALCVINVWIFFHNANKPDRPVLPMSDSTAYWKNRTGEEYALRILAENNATSIRERFDSLTAEYERLEEVKPAVITRTETEIRIDSVFVSTQVNRDSLGNVAFNWTYEETYNDMNGFHIKGSTVADSLLTEAKTTIENLSLKSDLYLSLADGPEDRLQVLVRSGNPRMTISNVEGSLIDVQNSKAFKKYFPVKKWSIGVGIGYGLGVGINNKSFVHGPQITVGVYRNLYSF